MGGIQGWEWIWILIIALLLFGPKKLPDLGRAVGKAIREFKHAANGILSDEEKKAEPEKKEAAQARVQTEVLAEPPIQAPLSPAEVESLQIVRAQDEIYEEEDEIYEKEGEAEEKEKGLST